MFNLDKDCIKNWDEISYSLKRSDYTGVVRSFSSTFEFTNKAYNLLLQEYLTRYLNAMATIAVYVADEQHIFREVYTARLDFSTLSIHDNILSMNTFDDSIAAILKANKSTKYEYPVSELKEERTLAYDHLKMTNTISWVDAGMLNEDGTESKMNMVSLGEGDHHPMPMFIKSTEVPCKNVLNYVDVFASNNKQMGDVAPFVTAEINANVHLSIKFDFAVHSHENFSFTLIHKKNDGTYTELYQQDINTYVDGPDTVYTFEYDAHLTLLQYESIALDFYSFASAAALVLPLYFSNVNIEISFVDKVKEVHPIDIIHPVTLLNKLLYSMNGERNGITGAIVSGDARMDMAYLLAAESARGLDNAKVYSSYNDFCKWMEAVFGFVPVISGNTVTFMHRDSLFSDSEPIEAGESFDSFKMSVQSSLIHSAIRIGYDKVDYESVNGKDEFRWAVEFTTGLTINENKQELISPYRADAYGIEFLVNKRGEDTTDNESDKDLFFVGAALSDTSYRLVRDGYTISGVLASDTMFNVMYSPKSMIEANKRFIGVGADSLTFASSEGNSDVVINNVAERDNVTFDDRLFTVAEITFRDASTIDSADNIPVQVKQNGLTYVGYLKERKCKYGRYDGMEHTLIVKSII